MTILTTLSIADVLSSGEIPVTLCEYLDAESALSLTRTSASIYLAIPRNNTMSVAIWRKYLADPRYVPNRLVFDIGKFLVESGDVSRANFKPIVAVLSQKSGFMKINKLKSLCSSGKLSVPLLPRNGQWRSLMRLDQFALKRATKECGDDQNKPPPATIEKNSMESLITRLAGVKGRSPMVEKYLDRMIKESPGLPRLINLVGRLVREQNIPGLIEILELLSKRPTVDLDALIETSIGPYRTPIGDNILHACVRLPAVTVVDMVRRILNFSSLSVGLVNQVNLNHETPLLLASKVAQPGGIREAVCGFLITAGSDVNIPDKKGNFYLIN